MTTHAAPANQLMDQMKEGWTLPAGWYSDPALLPREQEQIFKKSWLYAGHLGQVHSPGDYFAVELAGMPLVITRDSGGGLRALVNVCRHRGTIVASGSGNCQLLQCPYHAWTYNLDGSLNAAPRSDAEPGFDGSELGLISARIETWGPFIFVNLAHDASPLRPVLEPMPAMVESGGINLEGLHFHGHYEWEMKTNWKIAVENYLECYHCPVAHPEFSKVIDVRPEEYRLTSEGHVWSQVGPLRQSVRASSNGAYSWAKGEVADSQFHLLWPNFTLNIYPGPANLAITAYWPLDHERTMMVSDLFYGEDVSTDDIDAMIQFSTQVTVEDQALVEAVHAGLKSGLVNQGRLLLNSEHLIHRFQRFVYQALEQRA